jgi:hypothetical protein
MMVKKEPDVWDCTTEAILMLSTNTGSVQLMFMPLFRDGAVRRIWLEQVRRSCN